MSSEFEFLADVSEAWEFVPSNLELDDFHFIPAVAKSKIGSSANLPTPAPLPVPPPQPKKGHYELPRSQPLSIPKFRPLCSSAVAKPLQFSSPIAPAVVLQTSSKVLRSLGSSHVCSSTVVLGLKLAATHVVVCGLVWPPSLSHVVV